MKRMQQMLLLLCLQAVLITSGWSQQSTPSSTSDAQPKEADTQGKPQESKIQTIQKANPWIKSKTAQHSTAAAAAVENTKANIAVRFGTRVAVLQEDKEGDKTPDCVKKTADSLDDKDAVRDTPNDIYQPFAAVFDVLGSFGDAGSGSVPAAQSGIQTQAFGHLDWESQHYGAGAKFVADCKTLTYQGNVDFSFGGMIGLYPALVMENLTSTTAAIGAPHNRPMFQNSFRWTIGPRLNYPVFDHGEASVFGNIGQTFLIDQVTSFKQGDDTFTATPVSNDAGRAAFFLEGGIQFKIYPSTIWVAHDNKSTLDPFFTVAGGVRKDTRFSAAGDLAGFHHPQDRVFFQFLINLYNIVKPSTFSSDIKPGPPASIRFGIDMEKPTDDDRIPTATRFYISANLNIMDIFHPTPASATAPQK